MLAKKTSLPWKKAAPKSHKARNGALIGMGLGSTIFAVLMKRKNR